MSQQRSSSGSGGVRNLRAMFENHDAPTSSPERTRGRSPAGSVTSNGDPTARPTSKVRASFVSVDQRAGGMSQDLSGGVGKGLDEGQNNSTVAPGSNNTSPSQKWQEDRILPKDLRKSTGSEAEDIKRSGLPPVEETEPIQAAGAAVATTSAPKANPAQPADEKTSHAGHGLTEPPTAAAQANTATPGKREGGSIAALGIPTDLPAGHAPSDKPDKPTTSAEESPAAMRPADPKDAHAVSGGAALPPPADPLASLKSSNGSTEKPQDASTSNGVKKPSAAASSKPTLSTKKLDKQPSKSTLNKSTANQPKSPTTPKSASSGVSKASPSYAKPTAAKSGRPAASNATATTASNTAKDAKQQSPSSKPFVKPRPKSPTKPVRLPSHLTAPTASSAAKHDSGAGNTLSQSTSGSSLHRKPSTINRDRSSLTKPAAQQIKKQPSRASLPSTSSTRRPESRTSTKPADEGFLARMMRPTASSASKTHDKTEVKSPPRPTPASGAGLQRSGTLKNKASNVKNKLAEAGKEAKEKVVGEGKDTHIHEQGSNSNGVETERQTDGTLISNTQLPDAKHANGNGKAEVVEPTASPAQEESSQIDVTPQNLESVPPGTEIETPHFEGNTIR